MKREQKVEILGQKGGTRHISVLSLGTALGQGLGQNVQS